MRRLTPALLGLVAGGLLLAGCGAVATPGPAATALVRASEAPVAAPRLAPEPAATAVPPTLTPLPEIDTPIAATPTPTSPGATPVFTFTPTEPPTPDPNLGVGKVIYEDDFDGEGGWAWPYTENDVAAFSVGGNRLNAVMKVGNVGGPRLVAGQPAQQIGDQQLQVTALTNLCYAKDEYGVLFRANAAATDGYLFKLSCEGKARVEALRNLKPVVLADWTASPAIVPGVPAENNLLVWAGRGQLQFFINGKHLFSVIDKTFAQGTFAFYVYDRTNGGASVSFDKLVVKAVSLP